MASNPQEVCDLEAPYFAQLFSATLYIIHEDFFEQYPGNVTDKMNIQLCNHPTAQEVWKSVCNLSADSALSVDGFI